jgi:hypothetical protein
MLREWRMPDLKSQRDWIAGLCSFVLHLLILVGLAAWSVGIGIVGQSLTIESGQLSQEDMPTLELADRAPMEVEPQPDDATSTFPNIGAIPGAAPVNLQTVPPEIPSAFLQPELSSDLQLPLGGGNLGFADTSLDGRKKENRARLALENGGSPESEAAVERALEYLARHQLNNGSWSLSFESSCEGQCEPDGNRVDSYRIAATGLGLLCFLGAGKTDSDEEYGTNVSKAIYFLQQNLKTNSGSGYWVGTESLAQMYEHGIATLALCEAYQMSNSAELKESCQLAVNYIVDAQFRDGGWDYHPGSPGDLSIAAWQVMALKSAIAGKLGVPQRTVSSVDRFLEKCRGGEFMYRYRDRKPTASMTAIGTLIQIFRGRSREARSIAMAVEYMGNEGPSSNDMYYNYYATQVMFHHGGPPWKAWNYKMRDFLVRTQLTQGHSSGSWWFDGDHSNDVGGRLYTTCMACLTLEVYYRYLPVYSQPGADFQF